MYANFITPFITEDPAEENPSTPALASREELYPLEYQSFLTNLRQQRQQIISAGPPVVVVTPTGTTVTDPLLMRASPEREDEDDSDVDDLRGLEDLFASPDASQAGGGDFEEYYSQSQNRERLEEEIRLNELAARSFATDETRRMRGLYSPNTPSWSPVGGATTTTTTTTTDAVITAAAKEIAREEKSRSETEEGGNRGLSAAINNWKRRYEGAPRNVFTSSPENDASISDPEDVPVRRAFPTARQITNAKISTGMKYYWRRRKEKEAAKPPTRRAPRKRERAETVVLRNNRGNVLDIFERHEQELREEKELEERYSKKRRLDDLPSTQSYHSPSESYSLSPIPASTTTTGQIGPAQSPRSALEEIERMFQRERELQLQDPDVPPEETAATDPSTITLAPPRRRYIPRADLFR